MIDGFVPRHALDEQLDRLKEHSVGKTNTSFVAFEGSLLPLGCASRRAGFSAVASPSGTSTIHRPGGFQGAVEEERTAGDRPQRGEGAVRVPGDSNRPHNLRSCA